MSLDDHFNIINDKLQQLLKQQLRLKKENERLRLELEVARNKEADSLKEIRELGEQMAIYKLTAGEMNNKDKKEFEKKINQYIKEIDKCISFLSQ